MVTFEKASSHCVNTSCRSESAYFSGATVCVGRGGRGRARVCVCESACTRARMRACTKRRYINAWDGVVGGGGTATAPQQQKCEVE